VDDQLGAADAVVSGPCPLHILAHGLDAETEDAGDFPVGLTARGKLEALDLAAAEPRPRTGLGKRPQASGGAKRVCADELGAVQSPDRDFGSDPDSKGAGGGRLAGNVGGNSEARAQTVATAPGKDLAVAALEPDEQLYIAPAEPGVCPPARQMHRIVGGVATLHELVHPAFRIIVDSEQSRVRRAETRMIEQSEIAKAEIARDIPEQGSEARQVRAGARSFNEAVAEPPHRSRLARIASRTFAKEVSR